MPHSTAETIVNGDSPTSKTLNHFTSYPTVASGIDAVKAHPYGKKSIELVDQAYNRFGKPVEPYFETPYQYAKPYVAKADELGDKALHRVDGTFPLVKEQPETIWETGKSWAFWPLSYAQEAWNDEYTKTNRAKKNQGGLFVLIPALISFQLRVVSDVFQTATSYIKPKYEEAKANSGELGQRAKDTAANARSYAENTVDEATKRAKHYAGIAQEKGDAYASTAQSKGEEYANAAQSKGEELKGEAESKKEQAKDSAKKSK
ncbi:hypothetical protein LTR95_012555 [Oleoguttula sp. CCFEE 5521]